MFTFLELINQTANEIHTKAAAVFALGILVLFVHSFSFKFLINKSSIYLTMMLPVTIMLVTQTIATNLYLSLGLIGALSIVRYRTPVKSQYELAYIFQLIAVGVIGGVSVGHAFFLSIIMCFIPVVFFLFSKILPKINTEELRYNSSGKCEVNIVMDISYMNSIKVDPKIGRVLRSDSNFLDNQGVVLINFESFELALDFQKKLTFKPKSMSISNS